VEVVINAPKIATDNLIRRYLLGGHILSQMLFPDDPDRRRAREIIFRTKFADRWSRQGDLGESQLEPRTFVDVCSGSLRSVAGEIDPNIRKSIFDSCLRPFGETIGATLALKDSPSEQALDAECMRRWFGVLYTGRLILLIGSIEHYTPFGGSLNKAIHVMRETDGNNSEIRALARQFDGQSICDSSLKKAWRIFKPVAHLCAAYLMTELRYRGVRLFTDMFRDFATYCQHPSLLEQFTAFSMFCAFARFIEEFVTSFRSHGQTDSLISTQQIYSVERHWGLTWVFELDFPPLTREEMAALTTYRAPKSFV
jgi:hypothetical protein